VYNMPLQTQTMKNALIPLLSSSKNNHNKNNSGVTAAYSNNCNTLCNNDSWHLQKLDQETQDNDGANTSLNKENSKPAGGGVIDNSSSTFAYAEQASVLLPTTVAGSTEIIITKQIPTQKVTAIVIGAKAALMPIIIVPPKPKSKVLDDATIADSDNLDNELLKRNKHNDTFSDDDDDRSCKTALGLALAPFEPLSNAEVVMVRHAFDMGLNDAFHRRRVNHNPISRRRPPQPTRSRHQTQQRQLGEDEDDENFIQMMGLLDFSESCSGCRYGCDLCCLMPLLL
jgi:hypothetical protein